MRRQPYHESQCLKGMKRNWEKKGGGETSRGGRSGKRFNQNEGTEGHRKRRKEEGRPKKLFYFIYFSYLRQHFFFFWKSMNFLTDYFQSSAQKVTQTQFRTSQRRKHRRTAWGVQNGKTQPQAACPVGRSPLKRL
jgi:hypothetical protein